MSAFHGGASHADRIAEDHADRRLGPFRRMTLLHGGRSFLRRIGYDGRWFGVFVHHIDGPDPGKDLHDHPWWFVSIVLRGSYVDLVAPIQTAPRRGPYNSSYPTGVERQRDRWSIAVTRLDQAHMIECADPGTVTLVLRGPKARDWGFYPPDGWVSQREYDYDTRRPVREVHR